jgi:hydroxymethylglutaryl-CoA reductase
MSLHARQVAIAAGASEVQVNRLADQLVAEGMIRVDRAAEILKEWSQNPNGTSK